MAKRDIYVAIMRAAARGKSLYLSVNEVEALANDEAIHQAALNVLDDSAFPPGASEPDWKTINPRVVRGPRI